MKPRPAPETCPVCGEDVPGGALACPGCGADYNSSWKDDAAVYDALDLPDNNFDYGEINQEFQASRWPRIKHFWWVTGVLLVLALVILYFYGAR